jgi:hypothetical protein
MFSLVLSFAPKERTYRHMMFHCFQKQNKSLFKDMATIVLNVPDESLVSKIKQACKMLQGVASVKVQRPKSEDITKTAGFKEAMEDVRLGRVKKASSVDDMFNQILGEDWRNV